MKTNKSKKASSIQKRAASVNLGHPSSETNWFSFTSGTSGINVTEITALNCSAVWRAATLISQSIASLPCVVYQKNSDGSRIKALNHPAYKLLSGNPNPECTNFSFREAMNMHLLLNGNAYAEIEYNRRGIPIALWLLPPEKVSVARDTKGELVYIIQGSGKKAQLTKEQIIHVVGPSSNGIHGYGRVRLAAESIGLTLAAEKYGAAFFGNGARVSGTLTHPGQLGEEEQANLKKSLTDSYTGPEHTAKIMVLEEGMSWTPISLTAEEAQFLQTRKFQTEEVARWFNLRTAWLDSTQTGGTPEHLGIDFVTWTLRSELQRYEDEFARKLLGDSGEYYVEHKVDALLRGDTISRYNAYKIGLEMGFLTIDEIRELENLPKLVKNTA